ncbi:hypothetical protein M409DRAFT_66723 [Zasmidium cellare ATCC 36951]|uniref:Nucleoporin Pom152 n=1 Tax=Zasmidium cellare ATCC 36951 TaxID=1080233 RepID=A0A6A6CJ64_ZASCE|nr:uncharacterized protein M409DRAFT_66723 [Zasmidium cellare ATCC 36951]KAF2166240.1 hypothetical protein M409DRAFT_66723 [Zasmidium cellare ATCC 36951]
METPRTPRMRSAFPATPQTNARNSRSAPFGRSSPGVHSKPLPQIPTLRAQPSAPSDPFIPERIIDAPSQRLYAVALWVALWTWRIFDFIGLQESEEQSLWLFMKWVAIDGVFLFGLPGLRIPWLEWSSLTMTLIFLAHAFADGMLMFRVPIPIWAGIAALGRGFWGAYEMAVNEHNVNPDTVTFNDSLILGRQVIHILPEGSAILNPDRTSFCLDQTRTEARLPIMINATTPIGMDILRVDLDQPGVNETLHISKSQIKKMHQEASRLLSYNENPNEPKTLYYTVKKPGLYALAKVLDESNLEVARKRMAHTVVVPCPKAELMSSPKDRCRGELSDTALQVFGTPPMRVKYRKVVNKSVQEATFENIQPEDLVSPLAKQDHTSLVVPNNVHADWAKTRSVRVPISEGLGVAGRWAYAIDQITDGFGNVVTYNTREKEDRDQPADKSLHLHDTFMVHERPTVVLDGCTPQRPLKVAKDNTASLPLRYGSTGKGPIPDATYRLDYLFSPEDSLAPNGNHGVSPKRSTFPDYRSNQSPKIREPGLYTISGVSTEFCSGDVLEPASCLLQNPPEPKLSIAQQEMFDKCAGSPIGLSVDLDLIGTPPFNVEYRMTRAGDRIHPTLNEIVHGHRGQLILTPREAGQYTYEFISVSDAVYKQQLMKGLRLQQSVKPSASAKFRPSEQKTSCIDQTAKFDVSLAGEGPFNLDYELIHNGKRERYSIENVTSNSIDIETKPLKEGGDYTVSLTSITDRLGCKEFLSDEAKINVRHQKPKVSFGPIDGRRNIDILESRRAQLPLRLAGEAPWTVTYTDANGTPQLLRANNPNDRLDVEQEGTYKLNDVSDNVCPGLVDEAANEFVVNFIPRPEWRVNPSQIKEQKGSSLFKGDVCEGDEDSVEVLFKGTPPFKLSYVQSVKPGHGTVAPKNKELRAALKTASLRMDTSQVGAYEYKFSKLEDSNYDHNLRSFSPLTIHQKVNSRPSVAFTNPGKTYSFCSVESDGEEVIPVTLHGEPPFELEVEIKHHGTSKPEIVHYTAINSKTHNIHIPHNRLHLGKSAVSLRRVSDGRGCARTMDSTTPRVQISVHDAPTITPLDALTDYCIGDRLNFGLSGVAPFTIFYNFEGHERKANVNSGTTFRRLAEKPGIFTITGLQDSASSCRASTTITKHIHGMPSVRVSKGRDSYVDIHEGGEAEILFEFGGEPPFEFTYTRSSNTEKGGKKGKVLDMRSEVSEERSLKVWASEEGTYEVTTIKDKFCSYTKPGAGVDDKGRKRLGF